MVVDHSVTKVYGIAQGVIFVLVVVSAVFYRRRQKTRDQNNGIGIANLDLRSAIRRTPSYKAAAGPEAQPAPSPPRSAPPGLESAFPSWSKQTPAHEILEIASTSDEDTIEKAFRKQLKRYHPDRFASWGRGYQNRAHHVVILVQDARDRMLAGKKTR